MSPGAAGRLETKGRSCSQPGLSGLTTRVSLAEKHSAEGKRCQCSKSRWTSLRRKPSPWGRFRCCPREHCAFAAASQVPNGRRSGGKLCWGLCEVNLHEVPLAMETPGGVRPPFPCHLQVQVRLDKGGAQQEKMELGLVFLIFSFISKH